MRSLISAVIRPRGAIVRSLVVAPLGFTLLATSALSDDLSLPPPAVPGAINLAVTQENIGATICRRGWTATIRPPASYTSGLKRQQLTELGYADRDPRHYEEDHRVPLGVGGHPTDPHNLWPEPRSATGQCERGRHTAECKDRLEDAEHAAVCAGRMSLAEGQAIFLGDWIEGYRRLALGP
jgi:hypothetical protein